MFSEGEISLEEALLYIYINIKKQNGWGKFIISYFGIRGDWINKKIMGKRSNNICTKKTNSTVKI